jgi:hypothetical protein
MEQRAASANETAARLTGAPTAFAAILKAHQADCAKAADQQHSTFMSS